MPVVAGKRWMRSVQEEKVGILKEDLSPGLDQIKVHEEDENYYSHVLLDHLLLFHFVKWLLVTPGILFSEQHLLLVFLMTQLIFLE